MGFEYEVAKRLVEIRYSKIDGALTFARAGLTFQGMYCSNTSATAHNHRVIRQLDTPKPLDWADVEVGAEVERNGYIGFIDEVRANPPGFKVDMVAENMPFKTFKDAIYGWYNDLTDWTLNRHPVKRSYLSPRQEVSCKTCHRNNDDGVKTCYWCGNNPSK